MPRKNGTGPKGQGTGAGKGSGCNGTGRNQKGCRRAKGRQTGPGSAGKTERQTEATETAND